jgi:creatinine amidohydrolase
MGDYMLADILAGKIAAASVDAGVPTFVAPTMPFGVADFFGSSPGGLALSPATFRAVLTDLLEGLLRHGLNKIVILNGHGGNVPIIHEVTLALKNEYGLIIPSFYLWKVARQLMEARLGAGQGARFGHGAEPLLSLSLALRGGHMSLRPVNRPPPSFAMGLPVTGFGTLDFQSAAIDAPVEFESVPADARLAALPSASAALGREVAHDLVALAASFVRHVVGHSLSGQSRRPTLYGV